MRLTPRAGRDAVEGWTRDDRGRPCLKLRVASPPVEGAANAALVKLLARLLKVPKGQVRIVSGEQSRLKQIEVGGLTEASLHALLGSPPA